MFATKDALKLLKISKPTLYKLCKKNGVKPQKVGGHYRYSEVDLKKLMTKQGVDPKDIEQRFVELVNDIWFVLVEFSNRIWDDGETKLKEILSKNKENVFFMNISKFKE